jgi:hypothetical protein
MCLYHSSGNDEECHASDPSLPLRWGRARVGVDKMKTFWSSPSPSSPPLHPLPLRGGEIFGRICLVSYGLLSKKRSPWGERRSLRLATEMRGISHGETDRKMLKNLRKEVNEQVQMPLENGLAYPVNSAYPNPLTGPPWYFPSTLTLPSQ